MQGTVEDWRHVPTSQYLARFFRTVDLLNTDFDDAQGIWARQTLQALTEYVPLYSSIVSLFSGAEFAYSAVFLPQESMPMQLVPDVKRGMDDFPSLEERMKAAAQQVRFSGLLQLS